MDLEKYQDKTSEFWRGYRELPDVWTENDNELNYCLTSLGGEAGEVLNDWKKYIAGRYTKYEVKSKLLDELGDVLYYITRSAYAMGYTLEDLAEFNINKLEERRSRR